MTTQIHYWIHELQKQPQHIMQREFLHTIPFASTLPTQDKNIIPAQIMAMYIEHKWEITLQLQDCVEKALHIAHNRGHRYNGLVQGRPVWFYCIQFRMQNLYPLLPNLPTITASIQLTGYLGGLVKLAQQVQSKKSTVEQAIQQRHPLFYYADILEKFTVHNASLPCSVSIRKLIEHIETLPLPSLDPNQQRTVYTVALHPKVPPLRRTLLHDATLQYHSKLVASLLENGVSPTIEDHWKRNIAHIAVIIGAHAIVRILEKWQEKHPTSVLHSMTDAFGRTPADIEMWKNNIVHSASPPHIDSNNGGWNSNISPYPSTQNEIDIIDFQQTSWNLFAEKYLSCAKPVIMRNVPTITKIQAKWTKEKFLQNHGNMTVEVATYPYANSFGDQSETMTMTKFLQHTPTTQTDALYVFCQISEKSHPKILQYFAEIPIFSKLLNQQSQLYQGPAGTGAPMHMHTDAWNLLVHGKKRWFLTPPMDGMYSASPIQRWLRDERPHIPCLEFTQEAGDIVYIPKYWSHAVVNLQESIGVATEFTNPYLH
jgi:oxalate decarboxylase/phosphoglucose isomerase-like protein (cupin superfamily)